MKMADRGGYTTVTLVDDDEDSGGRFSGTETSIPKQTSDLEFHEFAEADLHLPHMGSSGITSNTQDNAMKVTGLLPESDSSEDEGDKSGLLAREKKNPSFWTFEYYQTFFDVDTTQVLHRILYSFVPTYGRNYVVSRVRPNPDLYGPFWVCATLVFTIAISGNLASYFSSQGESEWKYNFHKVTLAGCVVYSYTWLVPVCLWGFLIWRGNHAGFSFLEIVCSYGYSVSVFIPISVLWVFPQEWLRWILVIVGVLLSGSVIALTFWRALEDDSKKVGAAAILCLLLLHFALAIGFKLYFFKSAPLLSSHSTVSSLTSSSPPISLPSVKIPSLAPRTSSVIRSS